MNDTSFSKDVFAEGWLELDKDFGGGFIRVGPGKVTVHAYLLGLVAVNRAVQNDRGNIILNTSYRQLLEANKGEKMIALNNLLKEIFPNPSRAWTGHAGNFYAYTNHDWFEGDGCVWIIGLDKDDPPTLERNQFMELVKNFLLKVS